MKLEDLLLEFDKSKLDKHIDDISFDELEAMKLTTTDTNMLHTINKIIDFKRMKDKLITKMQHNLETFDENWPK